MTASPTDFAKLRAHPWFTAERRADGSRILLRGRRLEREDYVGATLPTVVTIEHHFDVKRDDGLPTKDQHEAYRNITLEFVEAVESGGVGVHVLGDTTQGLVREWFYTHDLDAIASLAEKYLAGHIDFEMNYDEDPAWRFLDGAIEQIRGASWE